MGCVRMVVPLDSIRAFHNAFRQDIMRIDTAANEAAKGKAGIDQVIGRYVLFNEVLVWHASGEEDYVFAAMDHVAPLVAEAYERDHRGLDTLYESLEAAINSDDSLAIARATCAFSFFLNFHLNKEEAHLYRIFNERVSLPDQWEILGKISQKIPQARFPDVVRWLFPLIRLTDQENMIRIFQKALPAPAFASAKPMIQMAMGDDWIEMIRRIPEIR